MFVAKIIGVCYLLSLGYLVYGKTGPITTTTGSLDQAPNRDASLQQKSFRDSLRIKLKLVNDAVKYSGFSGFEPSSTEPTPLRLEEALPLSSTESNNSGEDFRSILGVETTGVTESPRPTTVAFNEITSLNPVQSARSEFQPTEIEQTELEDNTVPAKRFKAAVRTKHTFEFRPVHIEQLQAEPEPKIVEVDAHSLPLEIHFKSASSRIKMVQTHQSSDLKEVQQTSVDEEPQRLIHLVRKPIIQEVREIITPYRRIVQEIHPVKEEVHTVITHAQKNQQQRKSKTSTSSEEINLLNLQNQIEREKLILNPPPPQQKPEFVSSVSSNTRKTLETNDKPFEQEKLNRLEQIRKFIQSSDRHQQQQPLKPQEFSYGPVIASYKSDRLPSNEESVELFDGNELEAIIPARLMKNILKDYRGKQIDFVTLKPKGIINGTAIRRSPSVNNGGLSRISQASVQNTKSPPPSPKTNGSFLRLQQQQQQSRIGQRPQQLVNSNQVINYQEASSSNHQNWHRVQPPFPLNFKGPNNINNQPSSMNRRFY